MRTPVSLEFTFFSIDLDTKNIQSGRGPRSDSDLLKWDNEINTFDDDYEGRVRAHTEPENISWDNMNWFYLFYSARICIRIRVETTIFRFSPNLAGRTHFRQNGFARDNQTRWSRRRRRHVVRATLRTCTKTSFINERTHLNWTMHLVESTYKCAEIFLNIIYSFIYSKEEEKKIKNQNPQFCHHLDVCARCAQNDFEYNVCLLWIITIKFNKYVRNVYYLYATF